VVAFDFFDFVFNFMEDWYVPTDPWNDSFAGLGYDSLNIIGNMGSILVFISIFVLRFAFILVRMCLPKQLKPKALHKWV